MAGALLELKGIGKTYPGATALEGVDLAIGDGEVLGLIGENGAGKSTLMKILAGVMAPSQGNIRLDGRDRAALTIADSMGGGIAFVHQELNLFDNLDVAANIFIGREPLQGGWLKLVDHQALRAQVQPILDRLGVDFAADTPVAELSLAQMQLVEIAKALSLNARLVIMDEPTSSLTLSETDRLMRVVADLKSAGVSIIFISHRLNEVEHCADRVVVLRDGRMVGELDRGRIAHDAMIRLMIGRDLRSLYTSPAKPPGGAVLELRELRTATYPARPVSFSVRAGEILGLAGLVGSLQLNGAAVAITSPRDAIDRGIYLIPEDRKRSGLLLDVSIAGNISLPDMASHSTAGIVQPESEARNAERQRESLNIRTPSVANEVGALSGGNQQKVVLAKWLSMEPRVIIFDEPTRGVDVGAKSEIYTLMRELADRGVAILMISSDMEEVIGVSDRIAVMHEGAIGGFLDRAQFSEHNVLQLAVGNRVN
jgi:ribose transport system ATP-binding protein